MPTPTVSTNGQVTMDQLKLAFPGVTNSTNLLSYSNVHPSLKLLPSLSLLPFSNLTAYSPTINLSAITSLPLTNMSSSLSNTGLLFEATTAGVSAGTPAVANINLRNYIQDYVYQDPYGNNNNVTFAMDPALTSSGVTLTGAGNLSVNVSQSFAKTTSMMTVTNFWKNTLTIPLGFSFSISPPVGLGIPDQTLSGNASLFVASKTIDLNTYFSGSQPITYSIPSNPKSTASVSGSTLTIQNNTADDIQYNITATATNSAGSANQTIKVNQPPYIVNQMSPKVFKDGSRMDINLENDTTFLIDANYKRYFYSPSTKTALSYRITYNDINRPSSGVSENFGIDNTTKVLTIYQYNDANGDYVRNKVSQFDATLKAAYNNFAFGSQSNIQTVNITIYPYTRVTPFNNSQPVYTYNLANSLINKLKTYDFSWDFMFYNVSELNYYILVPAVNPQTNSVTLTMNTPVINTSASGLLSKVTGSNLVIESTFELKFDLKYIEKDAATGLQTTFSNFKYFGFDNMDANGYSEQVISGVPDRLLLPSIEINANTTNIRTVDMSTYFVTNNTNAPTSYSYISYTGPTINQNLNPRVSGSIMTFDGLSNNCFYKLLGWGNNAKGSSDADINVYQFKNAPILDIQNTSIPSYLNTNAPNSKLLVLQIKNISSISKATVSSSTGSQSAVTLVPAPNNLLNVELGQIPCQVLTSPTNQSVSISSIYATLTDESIPTWSIYVYNSTPIGSVFNLTFTATNVVGTTTNSFTITSTAT